MKSILRNAGSAETLNQRGWLRMKSLLSARHLEHASVFSRLCKWGAERSCMLKYPGCSKADFGGVCCLIPISLLPNNFFSASPCSSSVYCSPQRPPEEIFSPFLSPSFYLKEADKFFQLCLLPSEPPLLTLSLIPVLCPLSLQLWFTLPHLFGKVFLLVCPF